MPPKRDEAALQEEEELQLAIALSQSEAEEKERMVGVPPSPPRVCWGQGSAIVLQERASEGAVCLPQRQKNPYAMYSKAEPTPVTSSAPPVSTLYTSPVVRASALRERRNSLACSVSVANAMFFMLPAELLRSVR